MKKWWNKFRGRDEIATLKSNLALAAAANRELQDSLHLSKLEIVDLDRRLTLERAEHEKTKGHVAKMWRFISIRHRVDLPAQNGTIRKILQDAERR